MHWHDGHALKSAAAYQKKQSLIVGKQLRVAKRC